MHGLIDKQPHIAALMGTLLAMLGDTFHVWNDFAPLKCAGEPIKRNEQGIPIR
ncbi:MAG: hypothetical protein NTZ41_01440 [Sphingobacteriales bacterium]|nr:hypothetical protein [Sphingobacteriales bacterium]